MAVLIEALTLVVRKIDLELRYPGGVDAFIAAANTAIEPPRFALASDAHLINVSFFSGPHAEPVAALLQMEGFVEEADLKAGDFALLDQRFGPTLPCDWLEWQRMPAGYTRAWLAGTRPGVIAAPVDWRPKHSRALVREDIRDEPGRAVKLAEDDGMETWLDTHSGRVISGLPHRDEDSDLDVGAIIRELGLSVPGADTVLNDAIVDALTDFGVGDRLIREEHRVRLIIDGDRTTYRVTIVPSAERRNVMVLGLLPDYVPAPQRGPVCEAINRANYKLGLGNFEMDMSDGEIQFRLTLSLDDPAQLSSEGLRRTMRLMRGALDQYRPAFVAVMLRVAEPEQAIEQVA